jgi:hypothetical protein
MKQRRINSFYIAVEPVASRFAKSLQRNLREIVRNKVYRVDHWVGGWKSSFASPVFFVKSHGLDKIQQLKAFVENDIACPKYALGPEELNKLTGPIIFARQLINSTHGRGIVEFNIEDALKPAAPLYTEYIKKKAEYRLHVFNGEVIDVQQKKKRRNFDADARDTRVRNLANGYVYTRDGVNCPAEAHTLAISAVRALGYLYGAVDIIYNEKQNKCYVLEVNSKPGLMGTTTMKYCNALINYFNLERRDALPML